MAVCEEWMKLQFNYVISCMQGEKKIERYMTVCDEWMKLI